MPSTHSTKAFDSREPFKALRDAEAFLRSLGASYGSNQRGAATGILFGDYTIAKWRNMNAAERAALHGQIDAGDHRNGPVIVRFFNTAPADKLTRLCPQSAEAQPCPPPTSTPS